VAADVGGLLKFRPTWAKRKKKRIKEVLIANSFLAIGSI
jgi:hypothetical protein